MKKLFILLFITFISTFYCQSLEINKIEPPNWWTDHSYNKLQLMVYGKSLDSVEINTESNDIIIDKIITTENTDYCFIDITIRSGAEAGNHILNFTSGSKSKKLFFPIMERDTSRSRHNGFTNQDVVYLIFPDRFANGDTENDSIFSDKEEFEFGSLNGRHGGDIQGMIDKLDYLKDLGITAIWSTPFLENNMYMSYHGYAATDLYKVDPRQGTNDLYKEFVEQAHRRGIKVIYDHVANHIGINHEWVENLPTETWINGRLGNHLPANHDKIIYLDPYASDDKIELASEGWFVDYMPDLNQKDTLLAKYIIQNTIWWIEFSGIDGIREDTYPYSNPEFMAEWASAIIEHYPKFNIVGEVWKGEPAVLAAYQADNDLRNNFNTHLPVVTDFAFRDGLEDYLTGRKGLVSVYELLGHDFLYDNPDNLLVFFDNHDIDRGMYAAEGDLHKFKVALTITLTTRGIPQLFYGTEIGLDGGGHHGRIREPFPGGFAESKQNAFIKEGRNKKQNEIFDFLRKLLHLRKQHDVLQTGKLTQYPVSDSLYVYKKTGINSEIIFYINESDTARNISLKEYISRKTDNYKITDLFNDEDINASRQTALELSGRSIYSFLIQ